MKRLLAIFLAALACVALPAHAQRRPVLPQIHEPHPYYFRELYLPQLTSGPSFLTWSPDSTALIYSMAGSLWLQRLEWTTAVQLTDGDGYDYQPDWSPDGKTIVFVRYEKDAMELWQLELASGHQQQLTSGGAVNVEPRWSPDGKKLLWVSTQSNGRFHIFVADYSNGELHKVDSAVHNAQRLVAETKSPLPRYYYSAYDMEINPTWSRDGKEILFVSNRGHIHGTGGFWKMKAEAGAQPVEIHYEETSWKARPDFSPDGSRMVYSSYLGRQWQNLWVMPANGGDAFPISYGDWDETNPRWSPDGNTIAFVSNANGNTEIVLQDASAAARHTLKIAERKYLHQHYVLQLDASDRARFSVVDASGRFFAPDEARIFADDGYDRSKAATEAHYFYAFGDLKPPYLVHVPQGTYTVTASRGPNFQPYRETIQVGAQQQAVAHVTFKPLPFEWDFKDLWVSADLHVHMNYAGTYRNTPEDLAQIGAAEGLDEIHELTVNKEQRFPDQQFVKFGTRYFMDLQSTTIIQGQEFHTSYWGHRGILGLHDHLLLPGYAGYPNTAASSLYPMNAGVYDAAHSQGAFVGAVHPFDDLPDPFAKPAQRITDELPVDAALGKLDYMEIVGFSDHKSTAAVWYKLLNLGFRIPAGAGTDATANYAAPIRGQVGFNRVYLHVPNKDHLEIWQPVLEKGATFATNGPLVDFSLDGKRLGDELRYDGPQHSVKFIATLRSFVPVDHLELVCNGNVVHTLELDESHTSVDATGTIPLPESGWCVLRAWSDAAEWPVFDNYTYATTSPIYVTIAGKRPYSAEDAKYFEAWIDRIMEATTAYPDWDFPAEKQDVLKRLHEGRAVYENLH